MLEFSRHVLEVLRQPLEEGSVSVARAARTVVFPARFMLVAAMNPCPCGYSGDATRECRCTPAQIARYRDRLSGPLRDRLDLTVEVPPLPFDTLTATDDAAPARSEASVVVRERVVSARARQAMRYDGRVHTNAELTPALMKRHCAIDRGGHRVLQAAVRHLALSARAFDRVRKVARTIADLAGADAIAADHIAEALQFRMLT